MNNKALTTKTITAENTFSDWVEVEGYFNFSLDGGGIWRAVVTVQRSFDGGVTPLDVTTFLSDTEEVAFEPSKRVVYRFGVKTGDFYYGTIVGRLGR